MKMNKILSFFSIVFLSLCLSACWFTSGEGSHDIDMTPPKKIEGNNYQIKISDNREQWNQTEILAESRLNFVLEIKPKDSNDTAYDVDGKFGVYSMRLDGSDFRTVLTPKELTEVIGYRVSLVSSIQRSPDNRYLAVLDRRDDLYIVDLETRKQVGRLRKVNGVDFYWLADELKTLYQEHNNRLAIYDFADKSEDNKEDITDRFRVRSKIKDFEYYPELNKIILFHELVTVHNFNSGGLLEKSPKEYYLGKPTSHPLFRRVLADKQDNYVRRNALSFFSQGNPKSFVEFPYKLEGDSFVHLDFGPSHIYRRSDKGLLFDSVENKVGQLWIFKGYHKPRALSIANNSIAAYMNSNCQSGSYLNNKALCDEAVSWDHYANNPEFKKDLNRYAKQNDLKQNFEQEKRAKKIDEIIEKKELDIALQEKRYKAIVKPVENQETLISLQNFERSIANAKVLYADYKYVEFANMILNLANELNTYLDTYNADNNTAEDDVYGLTPERILSAHQLFVGLSHYELTHKLVPVAQQCMLVDQDPFEFLIHEFMDNRLSDGFAYLNGTAGDILRIGNKLVNLVPTLVKIEQRSLAEELVKQGHKYYPTLTVEDVIRQASEKSKQSNVKKLSLHKLKEKLEPKQWGNWPGEHFMEILPQLTSDKLQNKEVAQLLSDTACGLLFGSYFNNDSEYLSKLTTSF